jgi:internalin A
MNRKALDLINECLETQNPELYLGRCSLTDDDFAPGSAIDVALRKCTHLKSLVLANAKRNTTKKRVYARKESRQNVLTKIPLAISELEGLTKLVCAGEYDKPWGIIDLTAIAHLTGLTCLDLDFNKITELKNLKNLRGLHELTLYKNKISELKDLESLTTLEILRVGQNNISDFRGLEHLTALKELYVQYNEISDLKGIENLSALNELILSNNRISNLSGLEKLTRLRQLHLERNNITDLKSLEELPNLFLLSLDGNKLVNVEAIKKAPAIIQLSVNSNRITTLKGLENATNLMTLYLAHNELTNLKGIENLSNLITLTLYDNQLTDIKGIENLSNLRTLDISNNKIKDISPLLALLHNSFRKVVFKKSVELKINDININNNPIEKPPQAIIEQGNNAILRYFQKINEEGIDYLYEAKLTLVGEGASGKTSLQKRLIDLNAELPKEESRTRGIEVVNWKYKGNHSHVARIWDFGGQDVYYPVHRFFLTENSVFVLLASTRQTHHNFDYWIPTIFQFGGNSAIILGQTCHQGNKVPWNDIGHYLSNNHFNIIKTGRLPYTEINLPNNNEGLQEIKKIIIDQIEKLPHYGKGVPKSWIPAREAIAVESIKNACISFEIFTEICKTSNAERFSTDDDIKDFAGFLHALGIVLWYKDIEQLKQWIILQPDWALNAVYKIIDDDAIQKRRGHIVSSDFTRVWSEACYKHRHDILKSMLQVFKIAFPKKHNDRDFIIPARLFSIPAEAKWQNNQPYLRLIYKYDFMPKGLVNQLSAHLSRLIKSDEDVWNDAVNFVYEDSRAQAQVIEDFYNRSISISAIGKDARGLMMIIREAMKDVTDSYKGVQPAIAVPCSCADCQTSSTPMFFDYQKLMQWSQTRKEVTCNESNTQLSIDELLFNVGLPNPVKDLNEVINNIMKPLKAFISYSKFDGKSNKHGENYLEDFKKHLAPLTTYNKLLTTWDDTRLIAGEEWDERIKEELNSSDIIFLLISPDFLNTKYIKDEELEIAIKRHDNGECKVVPIVLRKCGWTDIPMLSKLSGVPAKGTPIASWKNINFWPSVDDAWNDVYEEVKKVIQDFKENKS